MNKSQTIFTLIYLAFVVWMMWTLLHTTTTYGSSIKINVGVTETVSIEGVDSVSVSAEGDEYFRIYAGEARLIGEPDDEDRFSDQASNFPTKNWEIKDGRYTEVTIESEHFMVVRVAQSQTTIFIGGTFFLVIFFLVWFVVTYGFLS